MTLQDKPVMIAAIEIASFQETTRSNPVSGNIDDMYRRTAAGEGLIVSDNFAQLRQLGVGDVVDIPAPYGVIRLPIVGVIVDYTDQQGTIFMDRSVFVEHWRDDAVSDFHVWVAPQTSIGDVRQRIIERYAGERHVFVLTNEDSRQYILGIADQWFGLMNLQIAIAVLVAVLGIVNTLTVSIADRRRELGVLRAVGAVRRQIRQTIKLEALSVAVIGLVLGCALGAVNLYYILEMVQRDIIGMRLDYQYPTTTMAALIPVMLATAFLAALWPAEAAVRCSLVEALEYE
jgi:putative ABC transport system permease protein